jgi:hypothetical protein
MQYFLLISLRTIKVLGLIYFKTFNNNQAIGDFMYFCSLLPLLFILKRYKGA